MSFGYSFGDFVAGANLSYRLIRVLTESRGASIEYQEAISELGSIQHTFFEVGRMKPSNILSQATINAASCIVLSSVNLIGDFLERTKSYRAKICGNGTASSLSDSWQKMGWVLFKVDELKALKEALHVKLTSINVLLSAARFHGPIGESYEEIPVAKFQVREDNSPRLKQQLEDNTTTEREASVSNGPSSTTTSDAMRSTTTSMTTQDHIPSSSSEENSLLKLEPLKFKDAVGRKFTFPFHLCKTWAGMEDLILQAFLHVEVIGPHVAEGHYDLVSPNGEILLPKVWEIMIQPGWAITMHMWPMPEPRPPPPPPPEIPRHSGGAKPPVIHYLDENGNPRHESSLHEETFDETKKEPVSKRQEAAAPQEADKIPLQIEFVPLESKQSDDMQASDADIDDGDSLRSTKRFRLGLFKRAIRTFRKSKREIQDSEEEEHKSDDS